jgi:DNA-binding response OmpR family regulator
MSKRILVIDDDGAVRGTLQHLLAALGYEVSCASDGQQGVEAFLLGEPDLVITDIIMPQQEGMETILAIKRRRPGSRIIAMSGGGRIANRDLLKMAHRLGADRVIAKPFSLDELIAVVRGTLSEGDST